MSGISEENPYVGPRAIQTGERLYGRDLEICELFNHLQARRIVVLHSPSGAGKSSLVQAGLIPRLREAHFDVWRPIRVNLDPAGLEGVAPGTNQYLLSAMVSLEEELPAQHQRSPAELAKLGFLEYLESRPRRKSRTPRSVVLLFDQFEEVLTTSPRAVQAKRDFFEAVGQALDTEKYWALFILREDYLAALAPYRDHLPTQLSNTFRLDLLGLAGARETAEQLALAGGRSFPGIDQLIHDLSTVQVQQTDGTFVAEQGAHVEPVQLQVVCRRLWEAMPADDLSIDAEDIEAYADVSTSLAGYYADAVHALAGGKRIVERELREWVGQRLIVGGIRSQVRQGTENSGGLANDRIDGLLSSYLVRAEQRAGATWYELSHDRMVTPVQEDNESWTRQNLHAMQIAAARWEAGKRGQALLLEADVLADAVKWAHSNPELLMPSEVEFLERSRGLRREQAWARRKRWVWGGVLTALVVGASAEGYRRYDLRQRTLACQATGAEVEVAWSAERRQAVHDGLIATGATYAPVTAEKVMPWLERQAAAWSGARVEVCMKTNVDRRWDADLLDRSLWCLEDHRVQLESLVDELTKADTIVLQNAIVAVAGLESVDGCRSEAVLTTLAAPPVENRESVRAVRAQVTKAGTLQAAGLYPQGLEVAQAALERAQELQWRPLTAAARLQLGSLLKATGAFDEAETTLEEAYFEAAEGVAPGIAVHAASLLTYVVGSDLERHTDGRRWARHAKTALAAVEDGEGLHRAGTLGNLADVLHSMGKYEESKALNERALAIREKALGPDHPDVADSLNNLGIELYEIGEYEESKELHERALVIFEKALGPDHPFVAFSLVNLASVLKKMGEYEESRALHERALAILEKALGPDHPSVATSLNNLAALLYKMGEYEESKTLNERALVIEEKALGPDHPSVATSLNNLANVLQKMGEYEESKALNERALAIFEKVLGPDHPDVAASLNNLAGVYYSLGEYEESKELHERALAIYEKAFGTDHPDVADSLRGLARIELELDRPEAAIPLAERATSILGTAENAGPKLAKARFLLAQGLWDAPASAGRDHPRARSLAEQALSQLVDSGDKQAELRIEVETWLKTHGGVP